jgi:cholesterol transport system auxiliary component
MLITAPRASGAGFLYRRTEDEYVSDYYHAWVSPPAPALTQNLREWLAASGLFSYVTPGAGYAQPSFILEGTVSSLHGDYRDLAAPSAVLAVEFALLQDQPAGVILRLRRAYHEAVPLSQATPAALAAGWRTAWTHILQRLGQDLARCLPQNTCH